MAQARVLLINPLPCLAASPQCHLARSDGTPGKKHRHGQVGRKERNLLRKTVSLCNLCIHVLVEAPQRLTQNPIDREIVLEKGPTVMLAIFHLATSATEKLCEKTATVNLKD